MFGFCVRMFGSRLWLGYCECTSHLFVLVLLSLLLGRLVGCIWDGVGVGLCARVVLWRCVERRGV